MRTIRLIAVCTLAAIGLISCAPPQLYYWGASKSDSNAYKYDLVAYDYYKQQSPEAICDLIMVYEDMVTNPGGTRQVPPPGICAEYGYLLLTPDIEQIFASTANQRQKKKMSRTDFYQYGLDLMQREIDLYPESAQFVEPLVKRAKER